MVEREGDCEEVIDFGMFVVCVHCLIKVPAFYSAFRVPVFYNCGDLVSLQLYLGHK